jgi:glutamate--cysteine ligase
VRDIARDMLKLSRAGLEIRKAQGCKGRTESSFLDVLDAIVETGRTPADDLLALYHGSWKGDISRVFRDFAY